MFILQALGPDFNLKRLERYLTLAWQSGGVPVVVLTKADLSEDAGGYVRAAQKTAAGVDVFAVSVKTGEGWTPCPPIGGQGKTIVLLGSSGVGKSSLANALAGEPVMAVREIREDDGKGRHTTTHRQLMMLPGGVMLIDTPGMRELGIGEAGDGLPRSLLPMWRRFSADAGSATAAIRASRDARSRPPSPVGGLLRNGGKAIWL